MQINEYFKTPIWFDYKPEFIKSLNKYSNKYIIKAKEKQKDYIKKMEILQHPTIQQIF